MRQSSEKGYGERKRLLYVRYDAAKRLLDGCWCVLKIGYWIGPDGGTEISTEVVRDGLTRQLAERNVVEFTEQ